MFVCGPAQLNPEEKLLRTLLRTDCDGVRKSILQDKLQLPNHDIFLVSSATSCIIFAASGSQRKRKKRGKHIEKSLCSICILLYPKSGVKRTPPDAKINTRTRLPLQERPPDKDKVQPHLLQQAITDMITQVEDIGQVSSVEPFVVKCRSVRVPDMQ